MTGGVVDKEDSAEFPQPYRMNHIDRNAHVPFSSSDIKASISALPQSAAWPVNLARDLQMKNLCRPAPKSLVLHPQSKVPFLKIGY